MRLYGECNLRRSFNFIDAQRVITLPGHFHQGFSLRNSAFLQVWLCVSCGYTGCEGNQHAQKHCKAARSGAEHPLFFSVSGGTFRYAAVFSTQFCSNL